MANANDRAAALAYLDKLTAARTTENAKVKVTQAQIKDQAKFLLGWAKSKEISHFGPGSTMYKSGKLMVQMVPAMVTGLLKANYVVGNERSFKVNKEVVKALEA